MASKIYLENLGKDIMNEFDVDNNGRLDLEEF
jgi:hypothetical protein